MQNLVKFIIPISCLVLGVGSYFFWDWEAIAQFQTAPKVRAQSKSLEKTSRKINSVTSTLVDAGKSQVGKTLIYDPAYKKLSYPNGDIPLVRGVCTDVIIRALREVKVDLQELVHVDMKKNFRAYPKIWGLKRTDKNIDHRRVPNLRKYFTRVGWSLPITQNPAAFLPGDIVTWVLPNNREHIGLVTDLVSRNMPLIVHNIGAGTQIENILFAWKINGHFRMKKK